MQPTCSICRCQAPVGRGVIHHSKPGPCCCAVALIRASSGWVGDLEGWQCSGNPTLDRGVGANLTLPQPVTLFCLFLHSTASSLVTCNFALQFCIASIPCQRHLSCHARHRLDASCYVRATRVDSYRWLPCTSTHCHPSKPLPPNAPMLQRPPQATSPPRPRHNQAPRTTHPT